MRSLDSDEPNRDEVHRNVLSAINPDGPDRNDAIAWLISRYADEASRYVRSMVDPTTADDLIQTFWFRLLSGRCRGFDPTRGDFGPYVRMSLKRLVLDHYRTNRTHASLGPDVAAPSPPETPPHDLLSLVRGALPDLLPSYREALKARLDRPDASLDELARRFGLTTPTFRKRLQRARTHLVRAILREIKKTVGPGPHVRDEIRRLGLAGYVGDASRLLIE